jgi:hypothetical protein
MTLRNTDIAVSNCTAAHATTHNNLLQAVLYKQQLQAVTARTVLYDSGYSHSSYTHAMMIVATALAIAGSSCSSSSSRTVYGC